MDPAWAASVFMNGFLILCGGALCAYLGMSSCFAKRRSARAFFAYMMAKAVLWSAYDVVTLAGRETPTIHVAWITAVAITSILSYIVMYYTWNASVLKIGLVGLVVDILAGQATAVGMVVGNLLCGHGPEFAYIGLFGVRTFLIIAIYLGVFCALLQVAKPLARWIARYDFKREALWQALAIVLIAMAATTKAIGGSELELGYAGLAIAVCAFVPSLGLYVWRQARSELSRKALLMRSRSLMSAYDVAMVDQSRYLEESRQLLDEVAGRISEIDARDWAGDLHSHVQALKETCDRLRFGVHCDSPALDAVLVNYETILNAAGHNVTYRIAPLSGGGMQAAFATQVILGWAVEVLGRAGDGQRPERDAAVGLRVSRSANQLVFVLDVPSPFDRPFPKTLLAQRLPDFRGVVSQRYSDEVKSVRVLMEEVGSWAS